jgi:hypothetical protein
VCFIRRKRAMRLRRNFFSGENLKVLRALDFPFDLCTQRIPALVKFRHE